MKKTVAIIGATGKLGSAIALGLATAGYRVLLTDDIGKHPYLYVKLPLLEYRIRSRSSPVDVEMVLSEREASWEADIIIFAVPKKACAVVARKIKDVVTGKIVVNLMNPSNKIPDSLVPATTSSSVDELTQLLPHTKIVGALSTIFTSQRKKTKVDAKSINVLVGGDDKEAVSTVMQLVKDAGFDPIAANLSEFNSDFCERDVRCGMDG